MGYDHFNSPFELDQSQENTTMRNVAFFNPDGESKEFDVSITETTNAEINNDSSFHAIIPKQTKEWSEEPEGDVCQYIIEREGYVPDVTCEIK